MAFQGLKLFEAFDREHAHPRFDRFDPNILRMLSLESAARAILESCQHCFLGAQTEKHLLRKQTVSKKKKYSEGLCFLETKMFPHHMFRVSANGETFKETKFRQQCLLVFGGLKGRRCIRSCFYSCF